MKSDEPCSQGARGRSRDHCTVVWGLPGLPELTLGSPSLYVLPISSALCFTKRPRRVPCPKTVPQSLSPWAGVSVTVVPLASVLRPNLPLLILPGAGRSLRVPLRWGMLVGCADSVWSDHSCGQVRILENLESSPPNSKTMDSKHLP